jgi:RNA polymerase sigma-70 factor (ECF subfamily)
MGHLARAEQEGVELTDEAIVCRVLNGETALYELLMRRHNQRMYRTIRAVLRDDAEAEDAMQQAWLATYTHLAQFRAEARFTTWMLRIAVNEALGRLRQRKRLVLVTADVDVEDSMHSDGADARGGNPERQMSARQLGAVLEGLVVALPDNLRLVFVMREIDGLSTNEVAAVLALSEDNVKTRLHRAKAALRDKLTAQMGAAAVQLWRFDAPRCDIVVHGVMAKL